MPDTTAFRPIHQRARGRAELVLTPATTGARIAHLYQAAPLRLLFPESDPGDSTLGVLVNVGGGLAGGDRLGMALTLKPQARFTLTTPAAEKIYRSLGEETHIASSVAVENGACCEWLPQETILFDGARLDRRLEVSLEPDARLLAAEMLVFGRAARGERFTRGAVLDRWRVRRGGALLWADSLRLEDPPGPALASRFAMGQAGAVAMLLLAGPGAAAQRELARELAAGGASLVAPELLLARWVGEAGAVRRAWGHALATLRQAAFGHPPHLPRLWRS